MDSVSLRSSNPVIQQYLAELKQQATIAPLMQRVEVLQQALVQQLQKEDIASAYHPAEAALPDARIFVEPFVAARAIHSTPNAIANAVLNLLQAWKADDGRCVHAQVLLQGELHSMFGPLGVPVTIGAKGWSLHTYAHEQNLEAEQLITAFQGIQAALSDCV